jgi:hypothetical protein
MSPAPTSTSAVEVFTDMAALLQLTANPNVTLPPWPNRRVVARCPLCGKDHQSPLAYVGRLARRGSPTAAEIAWLREHLSAAGIHVAA